MFPWCTSYLHPSFPWLQQIASSFTSFKQMYFFLTCRIFLTTVGYFFPPYWVSIQPSSAGCCGYWSLKVGRHFEPSLKDKVWSLIFIANKLGCTCIFKIQLNPITLAIVLCSCLSLQGQLPSISIPLLPVCGPLLCLDTRVC